MAEANEPGMKRACRFELDDSKINVPLMREAVANRTDEG